MLSKVIENFRNMLLMSLLPYRDMLSKSGIEITPYDESDDETQTIIIGIKIIFHSPEVYEKFKGGKI